MAQEKAYRMMSIQMSRSACYGRGFRLCCCNKSLVLASGSSSCTSYSSTNQQAFLSCEGFYSSSYSILSWLSFSELSLSGSGQQGLHQSVELICHSRKINRDQLEQVLRRPASVQVPLAALQELPPEVCLNRLSILITMEDKRGSCTCSWGLRKLHPNAVGLSFQSAWALQRLQRTENGHACS